MAANNFISGGVNNNWNTAGNWSLGAVPTASDGNVATFTAGSPNCTVDVNAACNGLDFSAYANTITMTNNITISGNCTLGASMGISGSGSLTILGASNLTSNGKTWTNNLALNGSGNTTMTLTDNWDVDGTLTLTPAGGPLTINGYIIYAGTSLIKTGTSASNGTTIIEMNGTGTWTTVHTGPIGNNLRFNTAGTITVSGNNRYGTVAANAMTYIMGTIVTTGSTLFINVSAILNVSGITWNDVTISSGSGTINLSSDLNVGGNFSVFSTTTTNKINSPGNINVSGSVVLNTTTGIVWGSATIIMNGTGTISMNSVTTGQLQNNVTLNTGGVITFGTKLSLAYGVGGGVLTYISGTIVTTNSTLYLGTCTLNLGNTILNNVSINVTSAIITLSSNFKISGQLLNNTSNQLVKSNTPGTQRKLTMLAGSSQSITGLQGTDIDSADGYPVITSGALSNTSNWYSELPNKMFLMF